MAHAELSIGQAISKASAQEIKRFSRGLPVLDTIITAAPLLGLLGTVVGMMHTFGMMGGDELGAPAAITGGIAEGLIATAFGLLIAIACLFPNNYLNAKIETVQHEVDDAGRRLDLLLLAQKTFQGSGGHGFPPPGPPTAPPPSPLGFPAAPPPGASPASLPVPPLPVPLSQAPGMVKARPPIPPPAGTAKKSSGASNLFGFLKPKAPKPTGPAPGAA